MVLNLVALVLSGFAVYLGWWAVAFAAPLWWLASAVTGIAAYGLFRRAGWAQFAWHTIALLVSLAWVASVVHTAMVGWPYASVASSVISLVPGLLLLVVCEAGSLVVARYYRGRGRAG